MMRNMTKEKGKCPCFKSSSRTLIIYNNNNNNNNNIFFCVLGVELGAGCGAVSIRFRPNLTFSPHHATILFEVMDKTASEINEKK